MALRDPLGAERDPYVGTALMETAPDEGGCARVHGAAQDDQRPRPKPRSQLIDDPFEEARRRVHELVDGRPDDHDDHARPLDDLGWVAQLEAPGCQDLDEELVGAVLTERHLASLDLLHL